MTKFEAREALNGLDRKLLLLKGEKRKIVRERIIDSLLEEELVCLDKFIRETKKNAAS